MNPNTVRWTGLLTALLGACLAAPGGTFAVALSWLSQPRAVALSLLSLVRGTLGRWIPFLRREHERKSTDSVGLADGAVVAFDATVRIWEPSAPVDVRITRLHQHLIDMENRLGQVARQLAEEWQGRREAVAVLEQRLRQEMADLRARIEALQQQSASANARALPLIGIGNVLSVIPDGIANLPYHGGVVVWAVAVVPTVYVSVRRLVGRS